MSNNYCVVKVDQYYDDVESVECLSSGLTKEEAEKQINEMNKEKNDICSRRYKIIEEISNKAKEEKDKWIDILKLTYHGNIDRTVFDRLRELPLNYNGENYSLDLPVWKYSGWSSFFVMEIK